MKAKEALLSALDLRWANYRSALKTCRAEFSEEAVHDLRVETRRLLAVFDLLRAVMTYDQIRKARRELKSQFDGLDDLRDAQVLLADVSEYIHEIPELESFREHLLEREGKLLKDARKMVKKQETQGLSARVKKTRKQIESLLNSTVKVQLYKALDETYARLLNQFAAIDGENITAIHRLRILFKKFRYTVEIVHPLVENFPQENFELMHNYQTLMGEIQDMETALQRLADLQESLESSKMETARQGYENRRKLALSNYLEQKGAALTFWRSAPDQSFPWEK